jgi:pimeloyl-ACP methyl ester carboxylesterase
VKTDHLSVPGATLYYEVQGSGPVLLLICGGVYDADGYASLAQHFVDRFTVVTYDRRGNSRSRMDGPDERQRIEVHGDDAHRLLTAVGGGPAYVFGNSSGAIVGLELAARHPEQVRVLVAHEPPLFDLLPDRATYQDMFARIEEALATGGAWPAMQILGDTLQMGGGDAEQLGPDEQPSAEAQARMQKNMEYFITYEVPGFAPYAPDFAALRAVRVVSVVGARSEGEPPYRAGVALAERLGSEPVIVPGDHGGFGTEHAAFAAALTPLLGA